jgi:hypothetical protein
LLRNTPPPPPLEPTPCEGKFEKGENKKGDKLGKERKANSINKKGKE